MRSPGRYYKKALQNFAHSLYFDSDKEKSKQLLNESSVEKLEVEIERKTEKENTKDFLFDAGMVAGILYESAYRDDGNDGFNACHNGLYKFGIFVKDVCS